MATVDPPSSRPRAYVRHAARHRGQRVHPGVQRDPVVLAGHQQRAHLLFGRKSASANSALAASIPSLSTSARRFQTLLLATGCAARFPFPDITSPERQHRNPDSSDPRLVSGSTLCVGPRTPATLQSCRTRPARTGPRRTPAARRRIRSGRRSPLDDPDPTSRSGIPYATSSFRPGSMYSAPLRQPRERHVTRGVPRRIVRSNIQLLPKTTA